MGVEACCIPNLERMLIDIATIFNKNKLHYWVDWGVLLGLVRSDALIPHDKDIDIGIFEESIPQYNNLQTQIEDKGYKFIPIVYEALLSKDDFVPRIFFGQSFPEHCRNLCACDTFVWQKDKNKARLINIRRGEIYCNSNYYLELNILFWKGVHLKIPNNTTKYLQMRYGPEWRTPDPKFYKDNRMVGSE